MARNVSTKRAKMIDLNPREVIFVAKYLIDFNACRAAKDAGYAESTALKKAACWVPKDRDKSTKPHVWDAVQAELAKVVERARKTKDDIIAELENLAFSNVLHFYKVNDETGKLELNLKELTSDQAAALSQVTMDGDKITIKLVDKKSALVDLGKELGMFKNQHEHSGPAGGPIKLDDKYDLPRRLAFILNSAKRDLDAQEADKAS